MNKFTGVIKSLQTAATKHSPEILTGVGIAGMITTTVLAVRATPKALILIKEEERRQDRALLEEATRLNRTVCAKIDRLKTIEVIKVTWKCYLPSLVTGVLSTACLIGASSVNVRRNTALATAYSLSESALKEYQEKVIETIGEKKEQSVRDAVAKDRVERDPVESKEVIITGNGTALCYDVVSGRYFNCDIDRLKKSENELNRRMRDEMYVSLNDFYFEVGLAPIGVGDDLGWNIENGYIDLCFSSQLATNQTPCLVVDYRVGPRNDYRRLM